MSFAGKCITWQYLAVSHTAAYATALIQPASFTSSYFLQISRTLAGMKVGIHRRALLAS
jgi:hypothetical protein